MRSSAHSVPVLFHQCWRSRLIWSVLTSPWFCLVTSKSSHIIVTALWFLVNNSVADSLCLEPSITLVTGFRAPYPFTGMTWTGAAIERERKPNYSQGWKTWGGPICLRCKQMVSVTPSECWDHVRRGETPVCMVLEIGYIPTATSDDTYSVNTYRKTIVEAVTKECVLWVYYNFIPPVTLWEMRTPQVPPRTLPDRLSGTQQLLSLLGETAQIYSC